MRLFDIIRLGKEYLALGIISIIVIGILAAAFYYFIYKKVMKGTRKVEKKKMFVSALLICYLVAVAGVVFLGRGGGYSKAASLHIFSSYREAWNSFSVIAWRIIILNIVMFVPLGILLPIWSDGFKSFKKTLAVGAGFTLFIELTQLFIGCGIFDLDDIFNNILGTFIGYGLIMTLFIITKKIKYKPLKILEYLSPLILTILAFVTIFVVYDKQEFGNMSCSYSKKVNMKNVDVSIEMETKEIDEKAMVLKATVVDKASALSFAETFFERLNTSVDESKNDAYDETIIFKNTNDSMNLWVNYVGGTYAFRDSSWHDNGIEPKSADENTVREELKSAYDIIVPKNAQFVSRGGGRYLFKANSKITGDNEITGNVECTYYSDGTIKDINNNLIKYEPVMEKEIISYEEAMSELKSGKFNIYVGDDTIKFIEVKSGKLDYFLDTKGYYQPVYKFQVSVNGNDTEIIIPALK